MCFKLLEECNTAFADQFGTCNEFHDTTTTIPAWNRFVEWREPLVQEPAVQPFNYNYTYIMGAPEEKPKKEKNMKHLYHVIVVDLEEEILVDKKKVAENEDDAKFLAGVFSTLETAKLKPTEVTIIVNLLGDVKVKPRVKEVKINNSRG